MLSTLIIFMLFSSPSEHHNAPDFMSAYICLLFGQQIKQKINCGVQHQNLNPSSADIKKLPSSHITVLTCPDSLYFFLSANSMIMLPHFSVLSLSVIHSILAFAPLPFFSLSLPLSFLLYSLISI